MWTHFLLLLVALLLAAVFLPLGVIWTLVYAIRLRSWRKIVGYWSQSALSAALVIDLLGNVVCRDLLNWSMIQGPERYSFGYYLETISRVLGKNKERGTLTKAGVWLADLLNKIDPQHVERAADDTLFYEWMKTKSPKTNLTVTHWDAPSV